MLPSSLSWSACASWQPLSILHPFVPRTFEANSYSGANLAKGRTVHESAQDAMQTGTKILITCGIKSKLLSMTFRGPHIPVLHNLPSWPPTTSFPESHTPPEQSLFGTHVKLFPSMQSLALRCPSCAPVQLPQGSLKKPYPGKASSTPSLAQITLFCAPTALDYFFITSFRSRSFSSLLVGQLLKGRHSALLTGVWASWAAPLPHHPCHQASPAAKAALSPCRYSLPGREPKWAG